MNAELGVGTRVERTEEALLKLEELVKQHVPEATTIITNGGGGGNNQGGGGGGGGQTNRGQIRIQLVPRDQRDAHQRGNLAGPAAPARRPARRHRPGQPGRRQLPAAAAARRRRQQPGRPPGARNPRPRPRRRAPRGGGRAAADGSDTRAWPTCASAARKAGRKSRSASIGPRPPRSASRCRASPPRFRPTSPAPRRRSSASAATSTRSSCSCGRPTAKRSPTSATCC